MTQEMGTATIWNVQERFPRSKNLEVFGLFGVVFGLGRGGAV